MNIKLKAMLLTIAIMGGFFGFVYTMVFHPIVIMLGVLAATFYGMYKLVLNSLQGKEMRGPR